MSEVILKVDGLTAAPVDAPDTPLLHDVSLEVEAGTVCLLVGPSGSGKSTLLRTVAGVPDGLRVVAGHVRIRPEPTSDRWLDMYMAHRGVMRPSPVGQQLLGHFSHSVAQACQQSLDPFSRVGTSLNRFARRAASPDLPGDALRLFGLPASIVERLPAQVSGGEARRIALAQARVAGARLLLADEPTTGLDPSRRHGIVELLVQMKQDGIGIIIATHRLGLYAAIADQIIIVNGGRIAGHHPARTFFRGAGLSPVARALLDAERRHPPALAPRSATRQKTALEDEIRRPPPLIEVADVSFTHRAYARGDFGLVERAARDERRRPHVREAELEIRPGQAWALIGESGCGKSTLALLIAGCLRPDSGAVRWHGCDITSLNKTALHRRRKGLLQLVLQDQYGTLDARATPAQIVAETVRCHRRTTRPAARKLALRHLEQVDAAGFAHRRIGLLSGGERRRATLACALAAEPQVLILDEPTAGLDATLRASLTDTLLALRAERPQLALLLITHDIDLAREVGDAMLVMSHGRMLEQVAPDERPRTGAGRMHLDAQERARLPRIDVGRETGAVLAEYAIILTLLTGVVIGALTALGRALVAFGDFLLWWLSNPAL